MFVCFFVSLSLCFFVSLSLCFFVSLFLCFFVSLFLCFFVSLFLCALCWLGLVWFGLVWLVCLFVICVALRVCFVASLCVLVAVLLASCSADPVFFVCLLPCVGYVFVCSSFSGVCVRVLCLVVCFQVVLLSCLNMVLRAPVCA